MYNFIANKTAHTTRVIPRYRTGIEYIKYDANGNMMCKTRALTSRVGLWEC